MKSASQQILDDSRALVERVERQLASQDAALRALGVKEQLHELASGEGLTESQRQQARALFEADMAEVLKDVESVRVRLESGRPASGMLSAPAKLGRRKLI